MGGSAVRRTTLSLLWICAKRMLLPFDPSHRYDPIVAEKVVLPMGCAYCGHQRFVIETGEPFYGCAKCNESE
jgi:hypothetical protein